MQFHVNDLYKVVSYKIMTMRTSAEKWRLSLFCRLWGFFLVLFAVLLVTMKDAVATPRQLCPEYAFEKEMLSCTCVPDYCAKGPPQTHWLNRERQSAMLILKNVKIEDNGAQFICQEDCGGKIANVSYTLKVAYGPSNDSMSVTGNTRQPFAGNRTLNLTCLASQVNPAASYRWTDALCKDRSHDGVCSFVPDTARDDGATVTCRAANTFTSKPAWKSFTLDFKYPPAEPPVIQGYTAGQIPKRGDNLSCTVTGGNPLVQSVDFHCTDPDHGDRADTVNSATVTSSLTVEKPQGNNKNMTCYCSAFWEPEPGLYSLRSNATFFQNPDQKGDCQACKKIIRYCHSVTPFSDSVTGQHLKLAGGSMPQSLLPRTIAVPVIFNQLANPQFSIAHESVLGLSSERLDQGCPASCIINKRKTQRSNGGRPYRNKRNVPYFGITQAVSTLHKCYTNVSQFKL